MISQRRLMWLLIFGLLPALVFTSACSSRGNKSSVTTTNDTDTLDEDSVFGGGGGTRAPGPTINTNNSNGSLFQTDLDDDERPSGSEWANYGQVSPQHRACLSNGFNNQYGQYSEFDEEYYGAAGYGQSSSSNACLDPSQTGAQGYMSRDQFYNMGLGTYANMNYCLELVLSYKPTVQDAVIAHKAGAMALTRCYLKISEQLQTSAAWAQPQQQVYQSQNQNLRVLLLLLANDR